MAFVSYLHPSFVPLFLGTGSEIMSLLLQNVCRPILETHCSVLRTGYFLLAYLFNYLLSCLLTYIYTLYSTVSDCKWCCVHSHTYVFAQRLFKLIYEFSNTPPKPKTAKCYENGDWTKFMAAVKKFDRSFVAHDIGMNIPVTLFWVNFVCVNSWHCRGPAALKTSWSPSHLHLWWILSSPWKSR